MKEQENKMDNFDEFLASIPTNLYGLKCLCEVFPMEEIAGRMDGLLTLLPELPEGLFDTDDAFMVKCIRDSFNRIAIDNDLIPFTPQSR